MTKENRIRAICQCGMRWWIDHTDNKLKLAAQAKCPCGKTAKLRYTNDKKNRKSNSRKGN